MEPKCNPVHSSRPLATGLVQQHEALNLLGTLILERLLRARHPLSISFGFIASYGNNVLHNGSFSLRQTTANLVGAEHDEGAPMDLDDWLHSAH